MKHLQNRPSARPLHLLAILAALSGSALAQTTPFTGDVTVTGGVKASTSHAAGGTELRLGGLVIAKGTYNNTPSLLTADQGAGTRLLWYPAKAAFRAGSVTGTQWNETSIGVYSTAFGYSPTASGAYSTAMGSGTLASGTGSTAIGISATATGEASFASGYSSIASEEGATALGYFSTAAGESSFAAGAGNMATQNSSVALGYHNLASQDASLATGFYTTASGSSSASMGYKTIAQSFASHAIGCLNLGGGNQYSWVATDPLFEIGNGVPMVTPEVKSNALTVYKNGNMTVKGVITCAPGGDIPMFTGY